VFGPDGIVGPEVVEFIGGVSLLAPVFGSVMPELAGGLLAPEAAAGPPYTGPGAVPPELFPTRTWIGRAWSGYGRGCHLGKGNWNGRARFLPVPTESYYARAEQFSGPAHNVLSFMRAYHCRVKE
jgi:hypothetical protein